MFGKSKEEKTKKQISAIYFFKTSTLTHKPRKKHKHTHKNIFFPIVTCIFFKTFKIEPQNSFFRARFTSLHERSRERTHAWELSHTHTFNHSPSATVTLSREYRFIVSHVHTNTLGEWRRTLTFSRRNGERARGFPRARAMRSARQLLSHRHSRHTRKQTKTTRFFVKMRKKDKNANNKKQPKKKSLLHF